MRGPVPILIAILSLGGMVAVGGIPEILGGPLMFVAVVSASALLLAGIGWADRIARLDLRQLGAIALVGGFLALGAFAVTPMAYNDGPGRTAWIQGTALWGAGAAIGIGLAIVLVGSRVNQDNAEAAARSKALLFTGAALGSTAYIILQLAIAYDLGGA